MNLASAAAVLAFASGALAQGTFKLTPLPEGAMKKIGYYSPQRLTLSDTKPGTIKKLPEGLKSPRFGVLAIGGDAKSGGKSAPVYHVVLDESDDKPRLLIDSNGNGDLTDDGDTEWKDTPRKNKDGEEFHFYAGGGVVKLARGGESLDAHLSMYRFDPTDPQHAAQKDIVLFYRDYAYEGEVKLGGKTYKAMLADEQASGDFRGKDLGAEADAPADDDKPAKSSGVVLLVDVNGNGKFESRGESYDVRKPFNIAGTTYEVKDVSPLGTSFKIVKSSRKVAEVKPPPEHTPGKKITEFAAKDTDGKAVKFPGDYKGKVVMLDFWATWCGPCMGEVPGLVACYEKHHKEGFEIQGVSLDNESSIKKMPEVMKDKGMTWRQVADGKGWKAEVAKLYAINSIPAAFLVDGDTGEVLASGGSLRGEELEKTISKALAKKKSAQ